MHRALSLLVVVSACSCRSPAETSEGTKPTPPAATTQAAMSGSAAPSSAVASTSPSAKGLGGSIGEMLAKELASRPTGTPRVEDAFAAFGAQGVVAAPKQHLAAPVGARYCVSGTTAAGVAIGVCEYADAAAAAAGRETSTKAFGAVPNREIHVNKATTLTLLQSVPSDATRGEVAKILAAFAKL